MTHRVQVSGGHLGNAEAPTEPVGETVPYKIIIYFVFAARKHRNYSSFIFHYSLKIISAVRNDKFNFLTT